MSGIEILFLIIMGLCWGSFLNVLYVRTLSGESIILPPSKCPKCGHSLLWWQNIPIVSFLLLKGKCFFCNRTISIRYPIVECIGAAIFLFAFIRNVSFFDAIAVILVLSMFLVLSMTDKDSQKISVPQTIVVMAAGLVFNRYDIYSSVAGGLVGAGIILLFILLGDRFFNRKTFGLGDIWLVGALGAVVGIDRLILYLFYTLILLFITVLPNYITNLIRTEQRETLRYLMYFTITCLFLYVLRNISFWGANAIFIAILGLLLFISLKLVINVVKSLKSTETVSHCPLAPAIAISCLLFLF